MRVTFTARHMELPPALEELLMAKAEKLMKFGHKLMRLHVVFGKEKYFYTAELTLTTKGPTLVGKAQDRQDILTCFEQAFMKLKEQLRRHEAKRVTRLRRLAKKKL